jgi:hypothetical protein
VGDEQQCQLQLIAHVAQQVRNLRLDRHVECGDRFIANQQLRAEHERARKTDTLRLSARELVRIARQQLGTEPDLLSIRVTRARCSRLDAGLNSSSGSPTSSATVMRGSSAPSGS